MKRKTEATPTEYEKQRMENIERNKKVLQELGLVSQQNIDSSEINSPKPATPKKKKSKSITLKDDSPRPTVYRTRSSRRNEAGEEEENKNDEKTDENKKKEDPESEYLLTADEYFEDKIKAKAVRVDGNFKGWLNPTIKEEFGIADSAAEAWDSNGGGQFSYKNPLGDLKVAGTKPKTWSSAKFASSQMLHKNPNQYFYRHTAPGREQHTGDWTEEEKQTFLTLAERCGCGDKWGIFASYFDHRVGYQCSNFYRAYMITKGLIFDDNYAFGKGGVAIYVGSKGTGRKGM
ncbi:hypothetical protein HK098_003276 [Nowakowskiella sp. JEL0407]|nr:hypothetical protein HK098_003276 [Nowakowskiella sp. JEL0407]